MRGDLPLVSVVMPAYRCRDTICGAVESVLEQNVPLELLIVDDASDDDLAGVLAPYARDGRVRMLRNLRNMGPARSRNRGVQAARGKYVAFLDADDLWAPGKLEAQLAMLEETGMVLCATARELITREGRATGRILPVKARITYGMMLRGNRICCSSVVLRTDAARRFPMEDGSWHEDYRLWLEILREYGAACGVKEPFVKYRVSNTGRSGSKWHSAAWTWAVYRSLGFSLVKSAALFLCYGINGAVKYARSYLGGWK